MYVTAECYYEDMQEEGTVIFDWYISFTDMTPYERLLHHAGC